MKNYLLHAFVLICLSHILHGQQNDFTPYPEGYLNPKTEINMANAPDSYTTKSGNTFITKVKGSRRWNHAWYWDQVRTKAPAMFDQSNNYAIDRGFAPKVNEVFIRHNPQFVKFRGQVLHHHHFQQRNIAYALPEKLHIGRGYYKLWHNAARRPLIIAGAALSLYQIVVGRNPFAESPFDDWVREEAEHIERSALNLSIKSGYDALIRYISNCGSCQETGIYYADVDELLALLSGEWFPEIVSDSFFTSEFPADAFRAGALLDKATEFGVILRKEGSSFGFFGIIELPRYEY